MKHDQPVAIVTGAGAGIGREVCQQLASQGWSLVLVGRTRGTLGETGEVCEKAGASTETVIADVGDPGASARIVEATKIRFGRLDCLVNNAGLALMQPFASLDDDAIERTFAVNALGPVRLMRRAWDLLAGDGGGRIVNVSSIATIDPFPGLGTYGAAKAVLNHMGTALQLEYPDSGVRAFTVAPGAVETGMLRAIISEEMLPKSMALDPAAVAATIVSCAVGERDDEAGTVIVMRSPEE